MARPIPCDLCGQEDAAILQSSLEDGSTVGVGANCMPAFAMGVAQAAGLVALPADMVPVDMGGTMVVEPTPEAPKAKRPARRKVTVPDDDDQADAADVTEAED